MLLITANHCKHCKCGPPARCCPSIWRHFFRMAKQILLTCTKQSPLQPVFAALLQPSTMLHLMKMFSASSALFTNCRSSRLHKTSYGSDDMLRASTSGAISIQLQVHLARLSTASAETQRQSTHFPHKIALGCDRKSAHRDLLVSLL